nr:uncharacterized protein LOC117685382 [Crassostrea gigas]
MAYSKYASTRETTNFARVARIILGPCTDVLCAVLTNEICPSSLSQKVKTHLSKLPKGKKPPITKEQEKVIHNGNYLDFDITLLYFSLRNISSIQPHSKQWGNEPIPSDRSVSANIERIRLIRNEYGHCTDISISDTDFNKKVLDISSIIQGLEKHLGTSTVYQDAVVKIGNCCMDIEQESKYIKELLDLNKQIKDISEKATLIENRCVPDNVTVLYKRDILRWEEDDKVFLETHNFPEMLNQVRNEPYVTFVGAPGSGKTATARHIALKLQKEGYEICPVKEINKIENYCNRNIPQVFVIDDVLGIFGLNEHELHMMNKYREILRDPINPETKTLMTCREAVFKNEKISECILEKPENVVNLQSRQNSLNDDDKKNLLQTYTLDRDLLSSRNLASSSRMFPFLCKLYSNKKELEFYGPTFFLSPVPCIIKEMNSLKIHNKHQYASLVLLMVNGNILSENILNNENDGTNKIQKRHNLFVEMKRNILRKCKVSSTTESFEFIDALLQMEGTYTKKNDNEFTFIHDSMFEIIAYHFGHQFPELILKYASSDYIANNIKIVQNTIQKGKIEMEGKNDKFGEQNHENEPIVDLCIHLHESKSQMLAERLFKDVQDGEFYAVFGNEALKSQSLLQSFIAELEKHSYYNLYSLLFTELEDSKLCTWNNEPKKAATENMKSFCLKHEAHYCVMNHRFNGFPKLTKSVRGIALIILFGHHQILQYIVSQMIREIGNVDDLFVNSFNKHFQPCSNKKQDVTEKMSSFNHSTVGEILKISTFGEGYKTDIDKDKYTVAGADSEPNVDTHVDTSVDKYCEPVIIEQYRLLCLGCYSGDLNTVQILLQHVNADTLNYKCDCEINFWIKNPLIIACKCGFTDIVMELLKAGADVSIRDNLDTPLTVACGNGHTSVVRALLKAGANVNEGNILYTPLQTACEGGFVILVEELIKAKADVNLNVPLIDACINGNLCIVKTLIKEGADVNRTEDGVSPLLVACINGHFNIVEELITVGANVNIIACQWPYLYRFGPLLQRKVRIMREEMTPLIAACDFGYFKILKLLIKSGANVDQKNNEKTTHSFASYWDHLNIVKRLIKIVPNVGHCNTNERSLITACHCGQLDIVKQIIKGGADVNMKEGDKTPLIVACFKEHLHVVKELIKAGADVNLENEFISPLQVACYEGHLSIVKELNKAGFDYNHITGAIKGLMGACFFGHTSVVKELTACHVQVNLKYKNETPLTTASFMGHLNIFKELIKAGADINLTGSRKLLTLACYRGHVSIVRELIKNGVFVNQSDEKETSLSIASERGHADVVQELLKAGADVNQSDGKKKPTNNCM